MSENDNKNRSTSDSFVKLLGVFILAVIGIILLIILCFGAFLNGLTSNFNLNSYTENNTGDYYDNFDDYTITEDDTYDFSYDYYYESSGATVLVKTLNVRDFPSTELGNVVGTLSKSDYVTISEKAYNEGYYWYKIGEDEWIADSGSFLEIDNENIIPETYLDYYTGASVGNYYSIGTYEQDGYYDDTQEGILWRVLAVEGNKMLLVSEYGLDSQMYNDYFCSWEDSSIRSWLNDYFYEVAFTDDEKDLILGTKNNTMNGDEVIQTVDKVFLLSEEEVNKYFTSEEDRICSSTQYARDCGAYGDSGLCRWWLRDTRPDSNGVLNVRSSSGKINYVNSPDDSTIAVRPAIWVYTKG